VLRKQKGQRFLIVEVLTKDVFRLSVLDVDFSEKTVQQEIVITTSLAELPALLQSRKFRGLQTIVGAPSHILSTFYSSVLIPRDDPKDFIDETDIQNLISQALWRLFDRVRPSTARALGISETEVTPLDARIRGMKLDGHYVLNSIGFPARTVTVILSETFSDRSSLDSVLKLLSAYGKVLSLTEIGTAQAFLLSQRVSAPRFIFVDIASTTTSVFLRDEDSIHLAGEFAWGRDHLFEGLAKQLALQPQTARVLFEHYTRGVTSPFFTRQFSELFTKEFGVCVNGIAASLRNANAFRTGVLPPFYILSSFELPPVLFKKRFEVGKRGAKFLPLNREVFSQGFSFTQDIPLHTLGLFLEFCLSLNSYYNQFNVMARRRMQWFSRPSME